MKTPAALHPRQARIATRWVACGETGLPGAHLSRGPIADRVLQAAENENTRQRAGLLALLQHSRARNHWRVAVRRYLMLRECGYDIPPDITAYCEPLVGRMACAELLRAREAARLWADMAARRVRAW